MKAKDFDKKFDDNEDIVDYLDIKKARRPGHEAGHHFLDLYLSLAPLVGFT